MIFLEFFLISISISLIICKMFIMKLFLFVDHFFIHFIIYPFHIISRMNIRDITKRININCAHFLFISIIFWTQCFLTKRTIINTFLLLLLFTPIIIFWIFLLFKNQIISSSLFCLQFFLVLLVLNSFMLIFGMVGLCNFHLTLSLNFLKISGLEIDEQKLSRKSRSY